MGLVVGFFHFFKKDRKPLSLNSIEFPWPTDASNRPSGDNHWSHFACTGSQERAIAISHDGTIEEAGNRHGYCATCGRLCRVTSQDRPYCHLHKATLRSRHAASNT